MPNKYNKTSYAWDKKNTTYIGLKLNNNTDSELIEYLNKQESKQGYIRQLIREDIERHKSAAKSDE